MKLHVIGSSSQGNGYILESGNEVLILEAGRKFAEYAIPLNFDISKIVGCVITHEHGDHAKYAKEFSDRGIPVYALQSVLEARNISARQIAHPIVEKAAYRIGSFVVQTFKAIHDVPCIGFTIRHPDMGKMLFVTDSGYVPYKFPGLTHIMIEANYADDILENNMLEGRVPGAMRERLYTTHLELENTKKVLLNQDLSQTQNIILIHLSGGNSDSTRFVREITELTGIPTVAAHPNMTLDVSNSPY